MMNSSQVPTNLPDHPALACCLTPRMATCSRVHIGQLTDGVVKAHRIAASKEQNVDKGPRSPHWFVTEDVDA